jgi:hypothetical protein
LVSPKFDVYVDLEERAMLGTVDVNYQVYWVWVLPAVLLN